MSRGYGRTQRAILAEFDEAFFPSTADLASRIYGTDTPAARAAISRALAGMIRRGDVRVRTIPRNCPLGQTGVRKVFDRTIRGFNTTKRLLGFATAKSG
jgi:hypothetical protein